MPCCNEVCSTVVLFVDLTSASENVDSDKYMKEEKRVDSYAVLMYNSSVQLVSYPFGVGAYHRILGETGYSRRVRPLLSWLSSGFFKADRRGCNCGFRRGLVARGGYANRCGCWCSLCESFEEYHWWIGVVG